VHLGKTEITALRVQLELHRIFLGQMGLPDQPVPLLLSLGQRATPVSPARQARLVLLRIFRARLEVQVQPVPPATLAQLVPHPTFLGQLVRLDLLEMSDRQGRLGRHLTSLARLEALDRLGRLVRPDRLEQLRISQDQLVV